MKRTNIPQVTVYLNSVSQDNKDKHSTEMTSTCSPSDVAVGQERFFLSLWQVVSRYHKNAINMKLVW